MHGSLPRLAANSLALTAAASLVLAVSTAGQDESPAPEAYKTYLLNNFMGNDWRPVMMRTAELAAELPPLAGRVDPLRLVVTDNTAAAQNVAISNVVLDEPDILLLVAADAVASNQAIQDACDSGITTVVFDVLATAPCAWSIGVDFYGQGVGQAQWLVDTIGGSGTVFMDLGQPGAASAQDWVDGADSVLANYPDVKTVTYYGEFSPGAEQAAVATLLAANPQVDGLLTFGYGANGLQALVDADRPVVPTTGFAYNVSLLKCVELQAQCNLRSSPTWVSAEALRLAVDIRDGVRTEDPQFIPIDAPWFVTNDVEFPADGAPVLDLASEAKPDVPGGIMLPLAPDWLPLDVDSVLQPPSLGG